VLLHRVEQGQAVLREGDEGTSFYVVASGHLAVSRRDERGEPVVLARLADGDFFGEMALLSGARRSATVTAEMATELLEVPADLLRDLARRHPHVAGSLRRFYRRRLLANALAVSPIFRPFGPEDRARIVERFRPRDVRAGEVVIREGEPSDGLYVIVEGDLFGEMSLLRKAPAAATVAVRRGGTLLRLPRAAFDELVTSYPRILEAVSELSDERLESLDAIMTGHAEWTEDGLVLI
jgi:CRP-like cAMP-binding protein